MPVQIVNGDLMIENYFAEDASTIAMAALSATNK